MLTSRSSGLSMLQQVSCLDWKGSPNPEILMDKGFFEQARNVAFLVRKYRTGVQANSQSRHDCSRLAVSGSIPSRFGNCLNSCCVSCCISLTYLIGVIDVNSFPNPRRNQNPRIFMIRPLNSISFDINLRYR